MYDDEPGFESAMQQGEDDVKEEKDWEKEACFTAGLCSTQGV